MNIKEIIASGGNVAITVNPVDLQEFGKALIEETISEMNDKAKEEKHLVPDEVARIFGVSKNTLWRWNKEKYLCQQKVGRRIFYKKSDVDALLNNGE